MRSLVGHAGSSRVDRGESVSPGRAPWRMRWAFEVQSRKIWQAIAGRRSAPPQPSRTDSVETPQFNILLCLSLAAAATAAAVSCLPTLSLKFSTLWQSPNSSSRTSALCSVKAADGGCAGVPSERTHSQGQLIICWGAGLLIVRTHPHSEFRKKPRTPTLAAAVQQRKQRLRFAHRPS